jgi:hypothetical protein
MPFLKLVQPFSKFVVIVLTLSASAFADTRQFNYLTNPYFGPGNSGAGYGAVAGWTQNPYPSASPGFPYLTGSNDIFQPFWDNGRTNVSGATTVGFVQVSPGAPTNSLTQAVSLVVGTRYVVSYVENASTSAPVNVEVLIGGVPLIPSHIDSAVGGSSPFKIYFAKFIATSTDEDLTFVVSQINPGDEGTALFSDAYLTLAPEPSSVALLGTGLLGAVGMARRKFRKA